MSGANVFAGTLGGIYLSTNSGSSWKMLDGGGWFQCSDQTLALSGTNLFAGTNGIGVYLSSDNGTHWVAVNSGIPSNATVFAIAISHSEAGDTNIFAGTQSGAIYLSTNGGTSWIEADSGLPRDPIYALATSGTNLSPERKIAALFFQATTVQAGVKSIMG